MVTLVLYAFATRVRSSRAIERHCRQDVAYRVISGNLVPDHATIAQTVEPLFGDTKHNSGFYRLPSSTATASPPSGPENGPRAPTPPPTAGALLTTPTVPRRERPARSL
jgi:hypothetical protein